MKKQIPVAVIVLPALLILALVGYFLLVKPKQDAAGRLADEIATLETQVEVAMAAQRQPQTDESAIQVAEVFQVTKAMPDDDDMPGIILELNSVASASGIEFLSIAPQSGAVQASYTSLPINLSFEGNYYDLTDFLFRLRNLVSVRDGELQANGRLYSLETLSMSEGPAGLPRDRRVADDHRLLLLDGAASGRTGRARRAGQHRHRRHDHDRARGRSLGADPLAMASPKRTAEAALKAKERKQKKLLIVLAPVFLGLAVWQGPKMFGALFGGSPPPEAAPAVTTPTATTPVAPGTTPPPPAGQLADSDLPPEPNPTKLISFSLFLGHDPFLSPHPPTDSAPTTPSPTPTTPGSGSGGSGEEQLTAVIETNGVSETVSIGEEFPASDPDVHARLADPRRRHHRGRPGHVRDRREHHRDRGRRGGHARRRARLDAVRGQARRRDELARSRLQRCRRLADT